MNIWTYNIQTTLFAPTCVLCHAPVSLALDLCSDCQLDLPRQANACDYCALALPADSQTRHCRDCLHQPRFDAALAAFEYATPVDGLITRLKFHNHLAHARLLGLLLAQRVAAADWALPDCILPMPLHPRRYRQRGYNQAELIARHAATALHLNIEPALACRTRHTAPQLSLPASQRRQNVHAAFRAQDTCDGLNIAIVDDVVTTAHTAAALAAVLKQRGAATVQLWCVARA